MSSRILVTGSAGHLGEALVRVLRAAGRDTLGVDALASPYTDAVGSIVDRDFVRARIAGVGAVLHAATLHKPHVHSHSRREFVDVNVVGTLNLLEEAAAAGVEAFVFTSTTSAFGRALVPAPGAPAAWITEEVAAVAKNVYGATKTAAEDLCQLVHRDTGLPCIVLRTSRFFPEEDDRAAVRGRFAPDNAKVNELLYRRVDLDDAVAAHLCAVDRAADIGFGRYIVSATTPFAPSDLGELRRNAPAVVERLFPEYTRIYAERGWKMFETLDRVYVNEQARVDLSWQPRWDFGRALRALARGEEPRSALAVAVGSKPYHARGRYPFNV